MTSVRWLGAGVAVLAAALAASPTLADCPDLSKAARADQLGGPMASTTMGRFIQIPPPTRHVPFPEGAPGSVRIELRRGACFGTCAAYSVVLNGDGSATYDGKGFVLVGGTHSFTVSPADVACLVDEFRQADFWSLADIYAAPITDSPAYQLKLTIGGQTKTVTDYIGRAVGMPPIVTQLENAVDRVGGATWVTGNAATLPELRREHFDFHSKAAGEMLALAAERSPDEVVLGLIAAGAPVNVAVRGGGALGATALESAAAAGHGQIISALIAAGALADAPTGRKEVLLGEAVHSGVPDAVDAVLALHPDVNATPDGHAALGQIWNARYSRADPAQIDIAGVTKRLLAAGADPNLQDDSGRTALHLANRADLVALLLAAGAKLETRDVDGKTPLLTAQTDEAAVALIKAGADITAKDHEGATIWDLAMRRHYAKTLALLQTR